MVEINSDLISNYTKEFPCRYLLFDKLKKLTKRECEIHFDKHWNLLHFDNEFIYLSYMDGGNGEIKETLTHIKISEINNIIYMPWKDTFILFKLTKTGLKAIYNNLILGMFDDITKEHRFLSSKGFKLKRKILNLSHSNICYDTVEIN